MRYVGALSHGPIAQGHQPVLLVTVENLVAGLTRYAEIPADVRHRLAIQQAGYKAKALFHHRTRFPRHPHLPPAKGEKCYPYVRYGMLPMSRAAHCCHATGFPFLTAFSGVTVCNHKPSALLSSPSRRRHALLA